jgi:hypothetical protein
MATENTFTEQQIRSRNDIINKLMNEFQSPNIKKNYDTMLIESEMIKKQQDLIFLISSVTAVILVIVTINIIKK